MAHQSGRRFPSGIARGITEPMEASLEPNMRSLPRPRSCSRQGHAAGRRSSRSWMAMFSRPMGSSRRPRAPWRWRWRGRCDAAALKDALPSRTNPHPASYASFATPSPQGLHRGDRVVVMMRNAWEVMAAHFACAALHLCVVNVNTHLQPAELAHVMNVSDPAVLIAETRFEAQARGWRARAEPTAKVSREAPTGRALPPLPLPRSSRLRSQPYRTCTSASSCGLTWRTVATRRCPRARPRPTATLLSSLRSPPFFRAFARITRTGKRSAKRWPTCAPVRG